MLIKKLIIPMMILQRILEICLILMLIKKIIILMLIKKINNTNDEDFIENIKDLFNNKLDKKN